jgi:competence protein ComEA
MKLNTEPLRSWFGFTRRERRSSSILLLIIISILAVRFIIPEKRMDIIDITDSISGFGAPSLFTDGEIKPIDRLFPFDPNTVSYDSLVDLGLASTAAKTLIKYRARGGKFRYPSDIRKIFGIDSAKAVKLIPFIKVAADTPVRYKTSSYRKQHLKLNINNCDSVSLEKLPGIGPVLSARIIKYRHLLGGFANVKQLKEVYGLPLETFELIKERIFADSTAVLRIDINSADYTDLSHHPYLKRYEVDAILKYRKLKGKINNISDLTENKLITDEDAAKLVPYLKFE